MDSEVGCAFGRVEKLALERRHTMEEGENKKKEKENQKNEIRSSTSDFLACTDFAKRFRDRNYGRAVNERA